MFFVSFVVKTLVAAPPRCVPLPLSYGSAVIPSAFAVRLPGLFSAAPVPRTDSLFFADLQEIRPDNLPLPKQLISLSASTSEDTHFSAVRTYPGDSAAGQTPHVFFHAFRTKLKSAAAAPAKWQLVAAGMTDMFFSSAFSYDFLCCFQLGIHCLLTSTNTAYKDYTFSAVP